MKKLPILLICFIFLYCNKDDDTIIFEGKQSDLTGVWVLKSINLGGVDIEIDDCRMQETITVDNTGNAVWKTSELIKKRCNLTDKKLKFIALNSNFRIEYKSETIKHHGKFLEPGMIEVISIFKSDELETKSIYVFINK